MILVALPPRTSRSCRVSRFDAQNHGQMTVKRSWRAA
jgi:hypothetical protein